MPKQIEWLKRASPVLGCEAYVGQPNRLGVIVKSNKTHLSVSHPIRYPTWDEIKMVRERFLPEDRAYAMYLPPKNEFVNVHPNCFHLWLVYDWADVQTKMELL